MLPTIRGKVVGSLHPGTIDIHVGYGIGMLDGGYLRRFLRHEVPVTGRMPNTYVWLTLTKEGVVSKIEKMTVLEAKKDSM